MEFNLIEALGKLAMLYLPLLFSLCFHEYAHAFVAKIKGDNTAELMGRLTLNPFAHMDIVGTLVLPVMAILMSWGFLFGWAKPVPVNPRNLKDPLKDMFWVSLAGPLSNVLLALLAGVALFLVLIFGAGTAGGAAFKEMITMFIYINFLLAIFNLIPLYPLDGAKILARFLPYDWNRFLEERQAQLNMALVILFVLGGFRFLAYPIHFFTFHLIQTVENLAYLVS
ncbi:MAG: site-2 protease family protein [Bdellovibrio sp.]|nr:MAG: site-2 protease family protein [Bdellovibrio sp.]